MKNYVFMPQEIADTPIEDLMNKYYEIIHSKIKGGIETVVISPDSMYKIVTMFRGFLAMYTEYYEDNPSPNNNVEKIIKDAREFFIFGYVDRYINHSHDSIEFYIDFLRVLPCIEALIRFSVIPPVNPYEVFDIEDIQPDSYEIPAPYKYKEIILDDEEIDLPSDIPLTDSELWDLWTIENDGGDDDEFSVAI